MSSDSAHTHSRAVPNCEIGWN